MQVGARSVMSRASSCQVFSQRSDTDCKIDAFVFQVDLDGYESYAYQD